METLFNFNIDLRNYLPKSRTTVLIIGITGITGFAVFVSYKSGILRRHCWMNERFCSVIKRLRTILKREKTPPISDSDLEKFIHERTTKNELPEHPMGIPNLINKCFMNSFLQVLVWSPLFVTQLSKQLKLGNNEQAMSRSILRLLYVYYKSQVVDESVPRCIVEAVRKNNSQFMGDNQEDSFELFNTILAGIEEDGLTNLLGVTSESTYEEKRKIIDGLPVSKLFHGNLVSKWSFDSCADEERIIQTFTSLSVPLTHLHKEGENSETETNEKKESVFKNDFTEDKVYITNELEGKLSTEEQIELKSSDALHEKEAKNKVEDDKELESNAEQQGRSTAETKYDNGENDTGHEPNDITEVYQNCRTDKKVEEPMNDGKLNSNSIEEDYKELESKNEQQGHSTAEIKSDNGENDTGHELNNIIEVGQNCRKDDKVDEPINDGGLNSNSTENTEKMTGERKNELQSQVLLDEKDEGQSIQEQNEAENDNDEEYRNEQSDQNENDVFENEFVNDKEQINVNENEENTDKMTCEQIDEFQIQSEPDDSDEGQSEQEQHESGNDNDEEKIDAQSDEKEKNFFENECVNDNVQINENQDDEEKNRDAKSDEKENNVFENEFVNDNVEMIENQDEKGDEESTWGVENQASVENHNDVLKTNIELGYERKIKVSGVDANDKTDIEKGLSELMKQEEFDEEIIGCRQCENRKPNGKSRKTFKVLDPPPVLVLQINRFQLDFSGELTKIQQKLTYPNILDLSPFCDDEPNGSKKGGKPIKYSLYGVVNHIGNIQGGHYTAHIKTKNRNIRYVEELVEGSSKSSSMDFDVSEDTESPSIDNDPEWYYVSDTVVMKSTELKALELEGAYILMYERIDTKK